MQNSRRRTHVVTLWMIQITILHTYLEHFSCHQHVLFTISLLYDLIILIEQVGILDYKYLSDIYKRSKVAVLPNSRGVKLILHAQHRSNCHHCNSEIITLLLKLSLFQALISEKAVVLLIILVNKSNPKIKVLHLVKFAMLLLK